MKVIHFSGLVEMFNTGFEGAVQFSGKAQGFVREGSRNLGFTFYEGTGEFFLAGYSNFSHRYSLDLRVGKVISTTFKFDKREGDRVTFNNDHGPAIVVPIALTERAFLQIEPHGAIYY